MKRLPLDPESFNKDKKCNGFKSIKYAEILKKKKSRVCKGKWNADTDSDLAELERKVYLL